MKIHNAFITRIVCLGFALLGLVHTGLALAQDKTAASERWLSEPEVRAKYRTCSDGYYSGPQPGKARYTKDDYLWVVTPEFAKAYCLPDHFIDKSLKGASAIAYKPVYEGAENCGFGGNAAACSRTMSHGLEIYYPTSLKLPSRSDTKYNYRAFYMLPSSKHLLSGNEPIRSHPKDRAAWEAERPGAQAKFLNDMIKGGGGWGILADTHNTGLWGIMPVSEIQYIEELLPGYNYLALRAGSYGGGSFTNPRVLAAKPRQYVMALDKIDDQRDDNKKSLSKDYAHVIYLPERLIAAMKVIDKEGGKAFNELLQKAMPETFSNRRPQEQK